jgi:hypothetical protein
VKLGVVLIAGAAMLATAGRAAAAGPVTHYVINPSPIATAASLPAAASVTVTVTAEDATNTAVPGALVFLDLLTTTGGGSAEVGATALGPVPTEFVANAAGQVVVTYHTPAVLPTGGQDVIAAKNTMSMPTIVSMDGYSYSTVTAYTFSKFPLAAPGSLAANATVKEALTVRAGTTAVPGATVYLSFAAAAGGGTAKVGATPLTSTPQAVVASSTGRIVITYTTPATLPTTGADIITAQDATAEQTVIKQTAYSYSVPAAYSFAPSPIAATGTLAGNTKVTMHLTVLDGSGHPVAGAKVYLSFVPTTGGGTAKVASFVLTATPTAKLSDANGQFVLTYVTPANPPASGTDTITAQNAATGATIVAKDTYTF